MPSNRRIKAGFIVLIAFVFTVLYYTGSARQVRNQDFYARTVAALDKQPPSAAKAQSPLGADEDVKAMMNARLKEAESAAKGAANKKAPKPDSPAQVMGVGSAADGDRNVAGRKKFPIDGADDAAPVKEETKEDLEVELELGTILKKSPSMLACGCFFPGENSGMCLDHD